MYGINKGIKTYVDNKHEKNKKYLQEMKYYTEDYKLVSVFDNDINSNLSPQRYFAEVANRVNTIFRITKELKLYPTFVTITAPSEYHHVSDKYNDSTPKETAMHISDIWAKFLRLSIFKSMKKNSGHNTIYIRVFEPHKKSGVPHLHGMIWLPYAFKSKFKTKFFEHFIKHGFNTIGLKYVDRFDNSKDYDGERGAVAYILKYINKTFKHSKDDSMSDVAYWFSYHGIRKFITSRTLIPLWIYRKIKGNEDTRDLHQLTEQYKQGHIFSCFDKEYIMQRYIKKEKIVYDKDDIEIISSVEERIIYQKNHFISEQFKTSEQQKEKTPSSWTKKDKIIPTYQNEEIISHYYQGKNYPFKKHITDMKDYDLFEYHKNYDIENDSYTKYLAVENLMIDRKMIFKKKHDLNSFDFDEFFCLK